MEVKLYNIKCPICSEHSFLTIVYNESNKLYFLKCNRCNLESVNGFTDSINLFKNFEDLRWSRKKK